MDEGDVYSKADREEHARRKAEMKAQHNDRVRAIQEHMGLSWPVNPPKDTGAASKTPKTTKPAAKPAPPPPPPMPSPRELPPTHPAYQSVEEMPRSTVPAKVPVNKAEPSQQTGKKRWIFFQESQRWIEATELGFSNAITAGRPVRRCNAKPRLAPEILREPGQLPLDFT